MYVKTSPTELLNSSQTVRLINRVIMVSVTVNVYAVNAVLWYFQAQRLTESAADTHRKF
jgi:hypothetical protein